MGKVADYLREHLVGEVVDDPRLLKNFSTDGSVFTQTPKMVVFPRTVDDVRKVARFSWQVAEKGAAVPITARGAGSDTSGASVGPGIVVVFPRHLNKLIELDTKKNYFVAQPGVNLRNLQDILKTHARFLPPFPVDIDRVSLGGAVMTNSVGYHNVKYGSLRDYVTSLNVVLANGELIETRRLSQRELNRKKGLSTFEGDIYRDLDGVITDNWQTIQDMSSRVSHDNMGYALSDVKRKDGSFDLTTLLVGSQGTLGLITQVQSQIMPNNMERTLSVVGLSALEDIDVVIRQIIDLEPASLELIDGSVLRFAEKVYPRYFSGMLEGESPELLLMVEFDDSRSTQTKKSKKLAKILRDITNDYQTATEYDERDELWKFREVIGSLSWHSGGSLHTTPVTFDAVVPLENLSTSLGDIRALCTKQREDKLIWSHAGSGTIHLSVPLNFNKVGDRQKFFKLQDEFKKIIFAHKGSLGPVSGDGKLNTASLADRYSVEELSILGSVKNAFDPKNIFGPGIKTEFDRQQQIAHLNPDFEPYDYL